MTLQELTLDGAVTEHSVNSDKCDANPAPASAVTVTHVFSSAVSCSAQCSVVL